MTEQKLIKQQLRKNMIWNLIAFTIIFTIFDILIYHQVYSSLYQSVDKELTSTRNKMENRQIIEQKNREPEKMQKPEMEFGEIAEPGMNLENWKMNPRLIYILRDQEGNILNSDSIGRFYEEYLSTLSFDENTINKIYNVIFNGQYTYHAITFPVVNEQNEKQYVQLLINVEAEQNIMDNLLVILIIGTSVIVILAIIASYLLSKRTLKPIWASYQKQTEFVQNASHELRTPLTIIQAKQELLLSQPEAKIIDKSDDINLALKETRRLNKLIKDLMALARADSNQVELNKERTQIDAFIKEVCIPYQDFAQLEGKEIETNLHSNLEILVDRNKIHELLVIVLDNSIKYTQQGDRIVITTEAKEGKCVIEVKDTGIGVSQEGLKHIFERFYREDKARTRQKGGTGLGLSIADMIVHQHGGSIKITHNIPKGLVVTIKLPRN